MESVSANFKRLKSFAWIAGISAAAVLDNPIGTLIPAIEAPNVPVAVIAISFALRCFGRNVPQAVIQIRKAGSPPAFTVLRVANTLACWLWNVKEAWRSGRHAARSNCSYRGDNHKTGKQFRGSHLLHHCVHYVSHIPSLRSFLILAILFRLYSNVVRLASTF